MGLKRLFRGGKTGYAGHAFIYLYVFIHSFIILGKFGQESGTRCRSVILQNFRIEIGLFRRRYANSF